MKTETQSDRIDFVCIYLCFLIAIGTLLFARAVCAEAPPVPEDAIRAESDEKSDAFQKWAFFPVIASSTETGLQLGALAVRFFEPETDGGRTSTLDFIGFGTVEGQYFAAVTPNYYTHGDQYHWYAALSGRFWPANFYGIGNDTSEDDEETYESTKIKVQLGMERRFLDLFYLGPVFAYENERMDIEETGAIEAGQLPGMDGGVRSGLGATFTLDMRDNLNDARNGYYIAVESLFYEEGFGSDYRFSEYTLDWRHYFSLMETSGIALRGYARMMRGTIPFQDLSSPDGFNMLRGIENGRYRERDMVSVQAEWRFPVYKRFSGVAFADTAQVAHEISALRNDGWKYAVGAGVRYALNPAERFNIRLDLSLVDGGFGVALGIREAF